MSKTVSTSLKMLLVAVVAAIAMGTTSVAAHAEEIDTSANYTNVKNADGSLAIHKGGNFFAEAACIESTLPFPKADPGTPSEYKSQADVDKSINNGKTLGNFEQIKKVIYIYSQTDKLSTYTETQQYEAAWVAVAHFACEELPTYAANYSANPNGSVPRDESGWNARPAYDDLLTLVESTDIKVPAGLELAFFQDPETAFSGGHMTQTLVALKLYGSSTPDPEIVNTTVTANGTAASGASEAKVTIKDGESVTLEDKVELKNLESGKTYTLGWTVVNTDTKKEVSSGNVTVAGGETKVTIKPDKLSAEGTYTLKTRLTLDGTEVASHNANLDMKSETVVVTKETSSSSSSSSSESSSSSSSSEGTSSSSSSSSEGGSSSDSSGGNNNAGNSSSETTSSSSSSETGNGGNSNGNKDTHTGNKNSTPKASTGVKPSKGITTAKTADGVDVATLPVLAGIAAASALLLFVARRKED